MLTGHARELLCGKDLERIAGLFCDQEGGMSVLAARKVKAKLAQKKVNIFRLVNNTAPHALKRTAYNKERAKE